MPKVLPAAILALAVMIGPSLAAAPFAEISAALAGGDGAQARRLAEGGLAEPGLSAADHARLVADRGFARNLEGDKDGALADLTEAIEGKGLTTPEQARLYLERGLILDSLSRFDDAIGDYGAALRLVPSSAPALNNRANVFRRQNRLDDARRDYLASLAADNPAPEYPYYGLGQIAEAQGRPDEARNFYTRALAANPGYGLAGERLAALGGSAPSAAPIILKPPSAKSADQDFAEAPVVLHPPAPKNPANTPVSRPAVRVAQAAPLKPALQKPAPQKPVSSAPGSGAPLRPAFDNKVGDTKTVGSEAGEQAQLGAWRSEAEASEGWKRLVGQADGALAGFSPHIVAVDLPDKGRFYRLRVVTLDAKRLCATLTTLSIPCLPVRQGSP